jgi:hypothetical protein
MAAEDAAKKKATEEAAARKMTTEEVAAKKKAAEEAAAKKATEEAAVKKATKKARDEEKVVDQAVAKKGLRGGDEEDQKWCSICGLRPISGSVGRIQEGGYAQWLYTSGQAVLPRLLETSVRYEILHLSFLVPRL